MDIEQYFSLFDYIISYFMLWILRLYEFIAEHCSRIIMNLKMTLVYYQILPLSMTYLCEYTETCDFPDAPYRCIIFNPMGQERAYLTLDDTVVFYTHKSQWCTILRYFKQIDICCAAFRPNHINQLVVGGMGGLCLWRPLESMDPLTPRPTWIDLKANDYVTSVQWLKYGDFFLYSLMCARCIQMWDVDQHQMVHVIPLRYAHSFLWTLRFAPDMEDLYNYLKINTKGKNFGDWERCINSSVTWQTACWTKEGFLLFSVRKSSEIYCCIPNSGTCSLFLNSSTACIVDFVLNLNDVQINGFCGDCGEIQALAIDSTNGFVAILLKKRPFVIICLLDVTYCCRVHLTPAKVLGDDDQCSEGHATCITFAHDWFTSSVENCLFVGWSSGHLQQYPVDYLNALRRQRPQQHSLEVQPFLYSI